MECLPNFCASDGIVTVSYSTPMLSELVMYYDGASISPKLEGAEGGLQWIDSKRLSSHVGPFVSCQSRAGVNESGPQSLTVEYSAIGGYKANASN